MTWEEINKKLLSKLNILLDTFGIDYSDNSTYLSSCCPIHGGDNNKALSIYKESGKWNCWTRHCDIEYGGGLLGLIRGLLSVQANEEKSLKDTIDFASKFLNEDIKNLSVQKFDSKNDFVNYSISLNGLLKYKNITSRDNIRKLLDIPAKYYLDKGFSSELLNKYDIGLCTNPNKEMYNRVVIPVYDPNYKFMVGCTGRGGKNIIPKWRHSEGFSSGHHLYNLWFAKKSILDSGTIILVESPGNVLRLVEAKIENCVGLFGCSISKYQKRLLERSGATKAIIIIDNGDAGIQGGINMKKQLDRLFKIVIVNPIETNDIGDMLSMNKMQNLLKDVM